MGVFNIVVLMVNNGSDKLFDDAVSLVLHQVHGYRRCYRHCREVVMIKGCNSKGFRIVIRCSY